jgi:hypothetical protein
MDLQEGDPMNKPQTSTPAVVATGTTTVWTTVPRGPPLTPKRREKK